MAVVLLVWESGSVFGADPADALDRWLGPQIWTRDVKRPALSLGPTGAFDDRHVYAPSVLKDGDSCRMWYADVSSDPWIIRHAESRDGNKWTLTPGAVVRINQPWESGRLFYPTVVKAEGVYLLWYGSYWSAESNKTAIGFAVSHDGLTWRKHPDNPVLRPDPTRPWESHYTTSQSVLRLPDGSWRIWYATRKKPPFVNKYFAIGTATWPGPGSKP